MLSGVKLLDVPESSYIIAAGLGAGAIAFAWWGISAWLSRPRAAVVRTLE